MAELVFFSGTMDCGKSTLALQMDHNHTARGRQGVILTRNDRAGAATISSRLGLRADAVEVTDDFDFHAHVVQRLSAGGRVDYLICDEAQFFAAERSIDGPPMSIFSMASSIFTSGFAIVCRNG